MLNLILTTTYHLHAAVLHHTRFQLRSIQSVVQRPQRKKKKKKIGVALATRATATVSAAKANAPIRPTAQPSAPLPSY